MLSSVGCAPLTDDLTVVRDGAVCSGPRCLDLRPSSAMHLGIGEPARHDSRRRVALAPVAAEHPLRGFVHLRWGETVSLTRLPARERMRRLIGEIGPFPRSDHSRLIEFAARPHYELRRPREWSAAEHSVTLVRAMMDDHA
jgi:hypothetical protein